MMEVFTGFLLLIALTEFIWSHYRDIQWVMIKYVKRTRKQRADKKTHHSNKFLIIWNIFAFFTLSAALLNEFSKPSPGAAVVVFSSIGLLSIIVSAIFKLFFDKIFPKETIQDGNELIKYFKMKKK